MFIPVPNHPFAEVNESGEIRNTSTGNTLKPCLDKDGYLRVSIWNPEKKKARGLYVHRAVALVFIANPDNKPCVNHIDSDRKNNSLDNLEWVTVKENNTHGLLYGDILVGRLGEGNPNNVLSEKTVHEICALLEKGVSQVEISNTTKVNKNTIFSIRSGESWKQVSEKYNIKNVNTSLTEDTVIAICEDIFRGLSDKDINKKYELRRGTLRHIKTRKTFKHITYVYDWDKVQRSV